MDDVHSNDIHSLSFRHGTLDRNDMLVPGMGEDAVSTGKIKHYVLHRRLL